MGMWWSLESETLPLTAQDPHIDKERTELLVYSEEGSKILDAMMKFSIPQERKVSISCPTLLH